MDYKSCWRLQESLFEDLLRRKGATIRPSEALVEALGETQGTNFEGESSVRKTDEKSYTIPKAGNAETNTMNQPVLGEVGTVLFVEHPAVYTLGKSGDMENLLISQAMLESLGAEFYHIDRGGDITFHGLGQLVCYPILDLEQIGIGLRRYIEALEQAVIRTVASYGIRAGRIEGASGVWMGGNTVYADVGEPSRKPTTDNKAACDTFLKNKNGVQPKGQTIDQTTDQAEMMTETINGEQNEVLNKEQNGVQHDPVRKICAIGVRSSRYVTMHGFALNVSTDLSWFTRINPCGFADRGATSIEKEIGRKVPMDEVKERIVQFLSEELNVKIYKN